MNDAAFGHDADARESATGEVCRVAYVVHSFEAGGIERCVARLADGLDRRRFAPMVVCLDRSGSAARWVESADVPIVELRKGSGNGWKVAARLAELFRDRGVRLAHSHNWGTLIETAIACRLARPRVLHVHAERGTVLGRLNRGGARLRLRSAAMRWTVRHVDAVVSNAEATAQRVLEVLRTPADRVEIIPNGVDPPLPDGDLRRRERRRIRAELGIDEDVVLAAAVGRLVAVKDLTTAVRAVAEAVRRGSSVHLLLVGDGPEADALRSTAVAEGCGDRVHFAGSRSEIGPWLAAADLYVNTSVSEGMSQSVVEAMSMGLPLVVTDVGDNRRLAESGGGCGRVAAAGDVSAIAGHLRDLAADASARADLSRRTLDAHARRHSLARMVEAYERLYDRLTETRRPTVDRSRRPRTTARVSLTADAGR